MAKNSNDEDIEVRWRGASVIGPDGTVFPPEGTPYPDFLSEEHRAMMYEATLGMMGGDMLPLIELLKSDHPFIGNTVRLILAQLLSDENELGKSLILKNHPNHNTENKSVIDTIKARQKNGRIYNVYRRFRIEGKTYEKSIELTAEELCIGARTVSRAVSKAKELMQEYADSPEWKSLLPEGYKNMIV